MEFKFYWLLCACLVLIVREINAADSTESEKSVADSIDLKKFKKIQKRVAKLQESMLTMKSSLLKSINFDKLIEDKIKETKAKKANATEEGWYRSWNGYEYWISAGQIGTFEKSEKICEGKGARLATVGMREPAWRKEIIDNVVRPVGTWTWLGLSRRDKKLSSGFVWIDGVLSTSVNTAWNVGNNEPNNQGGNEQCAQLNFDANYLVNDKDCSAYCAALCERVAKK